jgi:hypothetical protein
MPLDVLRLVVELLKPPETQTAWSRVQSAWRAQDLPSFIERDDDHRDDVWPATSRRLGASAGVTVEYGVLGSDTYLHADDPVPLEDLACHVAPTRRRAADDFDDAFATRTNDAETATVLLHDELRAALVAGRGLGAKLDYRGGSVRVTWLASQVGSSQLAAALEILLAACRRPRGAYR